MFNGKKIRVISALSIVFIVSGAYPPSISRAADDPLDLLRRFPPNKGVIDSGTVEIGKQMLLWQIERGTNHLSRLKAELKQLRQRIEDKEAQAFEIAKQSQLFGSDAIREQLLGRALERLLEARVDMAASEALIEHLQQELKQEAPKKDEQVYWNTRRNALLTKLNLLRQQTERLKTLHQQNVVSEQDLLQSKVEIQTLESELAKLELEKRAVDHRKELELAAPLADVRMELQQVKARAKVSELQLRELARATQVASQLGRYQREIEQLVERLNLRSRRYEQVLMETEEAKLLLQQVVDATRDEGQDQPTKSDDE